MLGIGSLSQFTTKQSSSTTDAGQVTNLLGVPEGKFVCSMQGCRFGLQT